MDATAALRPVSYTHLDVYKRQAIVKIVDVYAKHARKYERVGEWIERIGWPRFFQLTGFEFTRYHIDDFKHAALTYARSAHVRY